MLERSSLTQTFNICLGGRLEVLLHLVKNIFAFMTFLRWVIKWIYSVDAVMGVWLEYCLIWLMNFWLKRITNFIAMNTFIFLFVWSVNTIKRIISKRVLIRVKLFSTFHALCIKRIHLWFRRYHISEIASFEMLFWNLILLFIILYL